MLAGEMNFAPTSIMPSLTSFHGKFVQNVAKYGAKGVKRVKSLKKSKKKHDILAHCQ
jgi:hypothetical protein